MPPSDREPRQEKNLGNIGSNAEQPWKNKQINKRDNQSDKHGFPPKVARFCKKQLEQLHSTQHVVLDGIRILSKRQQQN